MSMRLPDVGAMVFDEEALSQSWRFAQWFAGPDGHVVTLPELVSARVANPKSAALWSYTHMTASAEYVGMGPDGSLLIVVAHGVGPMVTPEAIDSAYANGQGGDGCITEEEFQRLVAGDYGPVEIVDAARLTPNYQAGTPWLCSLEEVAADPLLQARLGPDGVRMLEIHAADVPSYMTQSPCKSYAAAASWHMAGDSLQSLPTGHLLGLGGSNPPYPYLDVITLPGDYPQHGVEARAIGVRPGASLEKVHPGWAWLEIYSTRAFVPSTRLPRADYFALMTNGTDWFTQHPRTAEDRSDTYWPEFRVRGLAELGRETLAVRSAEGDYNRPEILGRMPAGANAYYVNRHDHEVIFYWIAIDPEHRVPSRQEILDDFDLFLHLLELIGK